MALTRDQFQKLRDKGLSVDQIVRFERGDVPDNSSQSGFNRPQKGVLGFLGGIGRGALSTVKGALALSEKVGGTITKAAGIKQPEKRLDEKLIPESFVEARNKAEQAGKTFEQIAELFIPIPGLRAVGAGKGIVNTLKFAAKEGLELGGKRAIQTGGDEEEVKKALIGGALGGAVGKTLLEPIINTGAKAFSKYLEKVNLRLTPPQKANLGKHVDDTVEVIQKNKITGSPERRLEKITDLYEDQEIALQKFLESPEAKARTVNRETMVQQLEGLKKKWQYDRDVIAIERQIDGAIETLKAKFPDEIPLDILNQFKRSTYKNAYNKAGDKVLDSVEHDIGDVARLNMEKATEGLKVKGNDLGIFNEEYGKIINARKLLKIASGRKEIGLIGKLMVMSVGAALGSAGGPVGVAVGVGGAQQAANLVAGTAARSLLSQGLSKIAKLPAKEAEEALIRILLPILENKNQED